MFYAYHGESAKREDAEAWLHSQGRGTRAEYKAARFAAYEALDAVFEDVAGRLVRPTWNPSKIATAARPNEPARRASETT